MTGSTLAKWQAAIEQRWYGKPGCLYCLLPLAGLFRLLTHIRRWYLTRRQESLPVPVVVVGNISVGGTGKTPVTIALVQYLQQQGFKPGIVSRGYGARAYDASHSGQGATTINVSPNLSAEIVGDEPLLMAQTTGSPVIVARDRLTALKQLVSEHHCDIVVSDDGLQHYRLPRTLEIAVVDASRGLGNGYCLPVGPLREPPQRLAEVDWIVVNGNPQLIPGRKIAANLLANSVSMNLQARAWRSVSDNTVMPLQPEPWLSEDIYVKDTNQKIYAVAAIGNPQRFFNTLNNLNIKADTMVFTDHHSYVAEDFDFAGDHVVIMTAKDAVKCREFARPNWWSLDVTADLPEWFWSDFLTRLKNL